MNDPLSVVIVAGSPSRPSRTTGLAQLLERRLQREEMRARIVHVRDLPPEALVRGDPTDPVIKQAIDSVGQADGMIAISPVYKAAYSGVFKAFIDVLPQFALRGKVVLPLVIGGSMAHVLAIDYAVRPMLQSLDPRLIVSGLFVLDKTIELVDEGAALSGDAAPRLEQVTEAFISGMRAHAGWRSREQSYVA